MPVVCMLNQKGGVGKTSTCYHLSGTLAQLGRRVLLVDNDPQASLTQGFLGPDVMRALAPARRSPRSTPATTPCPARSSAPCGPGSISCRLAAATELQPPEPQAADRGPGLPAGVPRRSPG